MTLSPLAEDFRKALNRHSRENVSNTPDYILAQYLEAQLFVFENATKDREGWYGRNRYNALFERGGPNDR